MIRIMINWDFISPGLQTISGIVEVHYVLDMGDWKKIAEFRTTVKPGSIGYKSLDDRGISTTILEGIKPQLDIMVRSYHQGVIMDKDDFNWIMEEDIIKGLEHLQKIPDHIGDDVVKYSKGGAKILERHEP